MANKTEIPIDRVTLENAIFVLNRAFNAEGDVFGVYHNTACDVLMDLEFLLADLNNQSK